MVADGSWKQLLKCDHWNVLDREVGVILLFIVETYSITFLCPTVANTVQHKVSPY